jgi:hypothetical protein
MESSHCFSKCLHFLQPCITIQSFGHPIFLVFILCLLEEPFHFKYFVLTLFFVLIFFILWWCWIKIWANFLPQLFLAQIGNPLIKKHTQWNSSILIISNMILVYTFTHLGWYNVGTMQLVSNLATSWHAIKVLWTNSFQT